MSEQKIIILGGTGNVGRELLSQISQYDSYHLKKHHNPTNVIALANSKGFLFERTGLEIQKTFRNNEGVGKDKATFNDYIMGLDNFVCHKTMPDLLKGLLAAIEDEGLAGNIVFVDATPGKDDLTDFHLKIINETEECLITANKNPLSLSPYETFKMLTNYRGRYGYRCTVMAGANTVNNLLDYYDTTEIVTKIEACFSGTLGYLCGELENGEKTFSQILKEAMELGYTEPHPRDDLNGIDVARKLTICARSGGYDVNLEDIEIEPFIDKKYFDIENVNDFMKEVKGADQKLLENFSGAKSNGNTIKYTASFSLNKNGKPAMKVGFQEVSPQSALGALRGSSNKVIIETDIFKGDKKYVIESPGAGTDVTAWGLRRDLLARLERRKGGMYKPTKA